MNKSTSDITDISQQFKNLNTNIDSYINIVLNYYDLIKDIFNNDLIKSNLLIIQYLIKNKIPFNKEKYNQKDYDSFEKKYNSFMKSQYYIFICNKIYNFYDSIVHQSYIYNLSGISTSYLYNISDEYHRINPKVSIIIMKINEINNILYQTIIDEHMKILFNGDFEIKNNELFVKIYEQLKILVIDISNNLYKVDYFIKFSNKLIDDIINIDNLHNKIILFHLTNTFPDLLKNAILLYNKSDANIQNNHLNKVNVSITNYGFLSTLVYSSLEKLSKLLFNIESTKPIDINEFEDICSKKNIHLITIYNVFEYPVLTDYNKITGKILKNIDNVNEELINFTKVVWNEYKKYPLNFSTKFSKLNIDNSKSVLIIETPNTEIFRPITNNFPIYNNEQYFIDSNIFKSLDFYKYLKNNRMLLEPNKMMLINSLYKRNILENLYYKNTIKYDILNDNITKKISNSMFKDISSKFLNLLQIKLTSMELMKYVSKEKLIEIVTIETDKIIVTILAKYIELNYVDEFKDKHNYYEIVLTFIPMFNSIMAVFKVNLFNTIIKMKGNNLESIFSMSNKTSKINALMELLSPHIKNALELTINSDTNIFYKMMYKNDIMKLK